MNEHDRQELERLKQQQIVLGTKLAELRGLTADFTALKQRIADLEQRLKSAEEPSLPAQWFEKKAETPVVEPEVQPKPVVPTPEPPPIIPNTFEPKVHTGGWTKEAPQKETSKVAPPDFKEPAREPTTIHNKEQRPDFPEPVRSPRRLPPVPPKLPQPVEKAPFELRLGTYWLVRVGIVMLLTGLVFLANYAYKNWIMDMGPASKVGLLYFAGAVLLGVGGWLYRKFEPLKNYAQVLIAGGLAEVYFTTYAAHHLHFLRIIQSPVVDAILLLVWAGIIVAIADWKKSEIMALLAIVLSYYDAIITKVGMFTLYSNLILAVAAMVFLVRNRWAATSLVSLIATYGGYAFWRFLGQQGWHWEGPEDGLWSGVWFLISYWLIFTAAGFLCRVWPTPGSSGKGQATARTGFISLNNGAFFGLFVLTMFQVRLGGFWKVALVFGAVLIVLSILSRRLLPNEPLTRNGYLTQGIFLVTLGFITKFSGTDLALVLAVESALLQVMSRHLRNKVLQFGSVACAALATAWSVWSIGTIDKFDKRGLIVGVAAGFFMIFNGWWTRWKPWSVSVDEKLQSEQKAESSYFTILGLLIWLVTTWQNTTPEWIGLTLGVESVLLLLANRWLPLLRFGSYTYAGLGMFCGVGFLLQQIGRAPLPERVGLYPHALFGLVMIANALWAKRAQPVNKVGQPGADWLFSVLGLAVWLITTWAFTPTRWIAPVLGCEALVFSLQLKWLRLPAVALFGQLFLVIAQFQCAVLLGRDNVALARELAGEVLRSLPWWNPAAIIAISIGLSHWWKRTGKQSELGMNSGFGAEVRQLCEILYGLATVCVLFVWLHIHFSPTVWLGFTCVLALVLTAYGLAGRLWWLAAFGQLFLAASVFEFFKQVHIHAFAGPSTKFYALVPIFSLCAFSLAALWWFTKNQGPQSRAAENLKRVGVVYRIVAVALTIGWVFEYVSVRNQFWVFAVLGLVLFLWCVWRRSTEALVISLVFTGLGFVEYFNAKGSTVYWPNLLCILAFLAQQQLARRKLPAQSKSEQTTVLSAKLEGIPEAVHTAMILLGGCSLWMYAGQLVRFHSGGTGFFLTAVWAAVAFVIFTTGFFLRERVYRWLGLGILAVALGRVVVVDVWQLETPYRILSFMALGVVLLVLGFIYTKYQEKIRQWL